MRLLRGHRRRRLVFERLESRRLLATLTVNTALDENVPDATLSLREAIEVVNGTLATSALSPQEMAQITGPSTTPDTIAFDIPGTGTQTIQLGSPLPALAQPVTIDGTTQPGYSASAPPLIVLDGSQAGSGAVGLSVNPTTAVTIVGLALNRFARGVDFQADGAASKLAGLSFSGVTNSAIAAEGNLAGSSFANITILGAVGDGFAIAQNLGSSTFTNIAIMGAAGNGISIGGSATSTSYSNVAIALKSGGGTGDGIQVSGDASNSVFSSIAVTGAGLDGIALGGAAGTTFTNVALSAVGHDGLLINGNATQAAYMNVAIALNSGSDNGLKVAGDGSSSTYGTVSVLGAGVDGIALGKANSAVFSNDAVVGAAHDGVLISGDATSSSFNGLVLLLNNGANTGLAVTGDLSHSSVGKITIGSQGSGTPQFAGGVSVGAGAAGTLFGGVTVIGQFTSGITIAGDTSSAQFSNNVIDELAAPGAMSVGIMARGNSIEVNNNVVIGPFSDGVDFQATSGAVSELASNVISTGSSGVGILLQAASGVQAALGCNDLSGNGVGLKVVGDGTTAGTIDAGGGPLGSATVMTGQNTFDQTSAAGTLAISLTATNATATVDAQGNAFADLGAIQDSTHNGGTGVVSVSNGTVNCPGTIAILMGVFTVAEGTPYNGPVAVFAVHQPVPSGPFSAMITWGDGSTSTGTITRPSGPGTPFLVSGNHTYLVSGNYFTSVTVMDGTSSYVAPAPGMAVVTDPAPVIVVPPLTASAGVPTGNVAVATFTDPGTPFPPSNYRATIDWGDKTPPILGTVTASGTQYTVTGGHTYAQPGKYTITVTVQDQSSPPASMTGPATVLTATTTTLAPPSPNPSNVGQTVTFVATVTIGTGSTSPPAGELVTFVDGSTPLGTAPLGTNGQAQFMTSGLAAGTHSIVAKYPGDSVYGPSQSQAVSQVVNSGLVTTSTQLVSSLNPAQGGQAVTFTAIVTPAAGSSAGNPTGTVTFSIDGVAQTPVTLTVSGGNNLATFTTASLGIGTHTISAVYNGDSTFAASAAPQLAQIVNEPPPPAVVALARFGYHAQPTALVLIFSQALDPARARNTAEYQLVTVTKGRHGKLHVGKSIAVVRAVYNPANKTVILGLAKRLNVHSLYQLTVNGTPPSGLTDPYGQFLDGAGNGQAGTNFVQVFGANILQGPVA
jgi:hypothetical protein